MLYVFFLGGGFTSKRGVFGKKGPSTTMLCVVFDKGQDKTHSGGANGLVYHWTGNQLTGTVSAHQGPVFAMLAVEKVCIRVCVCTCVCTCVCCVLLNPRSKANIQMSGYLLDIIIKICINYFVVLKQRVL